MRKPGESVATFVAELRSLTEYCNFGDTLEVMIRDHLVCGINDAAIQKRLLGESTLTYEKAVEIALNTVTAAQSTRELRVKPEDGVSSQPSPSVVHKTTAATAAPTASSGQSSTKLLTCYRCGNRGHTIAMCRVSKSVVCHYCGKQGHLQRACKSKSTTSHRQT